MRSKKGYIEEQILFLGMKEAKKKMFFLPDKNNNEKEHKIKFSEWYSSFPRQGKYRIRKKFEKMRKERLLDTKTESDGNLKILLTELGEKRAREYEIEKIKIKIPDKWNGLWLMIVFDIPENLKKQRNIFRKKLQEFNFHQYQKSIWLHPYPENEKIIFYIAGILEIDAYVKFAEVKKFDDEEEVRKYYNL